MIRGLSAIHANTNSPRTDPDKASFVGYILCWCEFVHLHHNGVIAIGFL
jgi:hypothetical protein